MSALYEKGTPHADGYRDVDVGTVAMWHAEVRLVDVREPSEFDGLLGHITGAELVPLRMVEEKAGNWPRDSELVMVCRSGGRSAKAAAQLARRGFNRVMNMRGGMLAWNEAELPAVRAAPPPALGVPDVLDELLAWMREQGGTTPASSPHVLLETHGGQHARLLSVLELMQMAGQVAAKDPGALDRVLRECRDRLAVARPEVRAK
ncbi:rhodanese-like domain-containing protein [Archangium violaceum]|uniref:rhodanese-like domain-containing protein n=1 Tax=Archangium violaceum TaxID=83451 RepID=UPI001EF40FE2|nr:rhodanese-like domain-containing protein [Archangium violaceum]